MRKTAKPAPIASIDPMNSHAISVPSRVRTRFAANSMTTTRQVRIADLKILDRRMSLINWATGLSVTSAVLTCLVVVLLFAANLTRTHLGNEIALLFMASMLAIGAGFTVFLLETTVAGRAVRVRSELLQHTVDEAD